MSEEYIEPEELASGCCSSNCHNPGAPEYGKCWKKKNNSGCCGLVGLDGKEHEHEDEDVVRVVRSTRTRNG